ncbi:hypothetical protein DERP_007623 [Dermatophagoides pteronyssinus]|uniref:Uncharacterized protein n=1 Tax=Dermatophagoides pteronyssinus TaxID=6956 RepID=A0ABQ8JKA2_DERPT|nr:hypothetical protein DERP_007623 [Dermatophagoides pteronyssinus]
MLMLTLYLNSIHLESNDRCNYITSAFTMIEVISLHSILNILYEKFLSPKVNNNLPKINHRVQTYTDDQDPKIDTSQCPKLSCGGNGKRS